MKRSRFSEEQVTYALRQADGGTAVADVCRQLGVSEATFYVLTETIRKNRESRQGNGRALPGGETSSRLMCAALVGWQGSPERRGTRRARPVIRRPFGCGSGQSPWRDPGSAIDAFT
jgi:hypothetical protein